MKKAITARELMTTKMVLLRPDMDMQEAINALLKSKVSGANVVDTEGKLVGVFSEKDSLRIFANGAFNMSPGARVADYMTKDVFTITPDEELFTIADLMLKHPFRRLPVVEDGILLGQVGRGDVLAGSRQIWEESPVKKPWTDSKYLTDEIKAALGQKDS